MADVIQEYLRQTLPAEVVAIVESHIQQIDNGDFESLLRSPEARSLFGHDKEEGWFEQQYEKHGNWNDFIVDHLNTLLGHENESQKLVVYVLIGYAALLSFIQSNVTGPPLKFMSIDVLFPAAVARDRVRYQAIRQKLLSSRTVDGIAAYKLTPNLELLCLAEAIISCPKLLEHVKAARWIKVRASFMHQRLLSEVSSSLQNSIYDDLDTLDESLSNASIRKAIYTEFLLERSTIHIHHGLDKLARKDIDAATSERQFEFALTGLLGKRTKFQTQDISQLVVLAKSHDTSNISIADEGAASSNDVGSKPTNIDLNDDTLLESISFTEKPQQSTSTDVKDAGSLSKELSELNPSEQPQLQPLDSVILLQLASSITNTSPQDGLTREETLPYATRVLEGGSANWQVYTQALLVRSRIEGYRSRTVERGLLQLQALVDQVIAETTSDDTVNAGSQPSTFLPKPKESENASVNERVRYVFQLASPTRWELEAELASRWVSLGGLRSALEIYERLEMWAEAALCWAATEREDKAKKIVRRQLFHRTNGGADVPEDDVGEDETWEGPSRDPPPLDAPRLYCILGDIGQALDMYEQAWQVSNKRYARAQRSLGRHYFAARDFVRAAEAYSKSLQVNQLNHSSWFALGCALLELAQYPKAVEAFSRCVQLDDTDAESWSNLAAALIRTNPDSEEIPSTHATSTLILDDDDDAEQADPTSPKPSPSTSARVRLRIDALNALKRAAALKRDSFRIWENVLIVSASLQPPDYPTILSAQTRLLALRGDIDGERAIDVDILEDLVAHVISSPEFSDAKGKYDASRPGLARMLVKFVDDSVVPRITASARLWRLVSKLALWRDRSGSALEAEEKAWRVVAVQQPGWEDGAEEGRWEEVVDATVRLCDAYESFGPRERTEGLGAGQGELVAKDWRFKARSAVRGILGKGKESWEGSAGWERLREALEGLKG